MTASNQQHKHYQALFDQVVYDSLKVAASGLAILYAVLAAAHLIVLPEAASGLMAVAAAATTLAFAIAYVAVRASAPPMSFAQPMAAACGLLALANSLLHLYLAPQAEYTVNVAFPLIGVGLLILSARWLAIFFSVSAIATFIVTRLAVPESLWVHVTLLFLIGAALSTLAHVIRLRTYRKLQSLTFAVEEKALLEREQEKFQALLETAPEAILVADADGRIVLANHQASTVFRIPRSELVDLKISRLLEGDPAGTDAAAAAASPPAVIEGIREDESRFPAEVAFTRIGEGGEALGMWVVRDVTERERAAAALRESEEKFRNLFHQSNDLIMLHDAQGNILDVNEKASALFGYERSELLGAPCTSLAAPDERKQVGAAMSVIADEGSCTFETTFQKKSAARVPVEVSASSFELAGSPVTLCIVRDISERKRMELDRQRTEADLRQAQKLEAIGVLAGGIAHDFNNILTAIIGFSTLAQRDVEPGSRTAEDLKRVLEASERARSLVQQILGFSRHSEQERSPVRMGSLVSDVLKLLRASLPTTIEIRSAIHPDCGSVIADATQLHQIVMNLCTNAYQAMTPKGGLLEVTLHCVDLDVEQASQSPHLKPGSYVLLTVRDSGQGIDPAIRERIFDPFFTTKEFGQGTGLGLSMVHGIVLSHGGAILFDSEPGQGTEFRVFLPSIGQGADETPGRIEAPVAGDERVLFIDDEPMLVDAGKHILESFGYRVTTAEDSEQVLELFRADPDQFDLVISDVTMPRLTGIELAREMIKIRPDMPIILVTGFTELITAEEAKAMGVREFITKPFAIPELGAAVRRVLDEAQSQAKGAAN